MKLAAWIVICCFVGAMLMLLATRVARAAALLDMGGAKIIVMTADELGTLVAAGARKDAEIEVLRAMLAKRCGTI